MIYNNFQDEKLSALGFGTMRLPTKENREIDEDQVAEMIDFALKNGVNYFDTAYPYHGGKSEIVVGKILNRYPRETWNLATKYPGHQIATSYDPKAIFEEQLEKCGVEYFDFYLLHNVYENSLPVYEDERWGIIDYFVEQKRLGRIRHLGFSTHGSLDTMRSFLERHGKDMEFCQIQLNYLDWTLQNAKEKYELISSFGLPVWIMEPVRGGKLAKLSSGAVESLERFRKEAPPAWAFRFLQSLPNVKMVLSGMSNLEQMKQNVETFSSFAPTTDEERETLFKIAEGLKKGVPCTACGYCKEGCPQNLDIPKLLATYNDLSVDRLVNSSMRYEGADEKTLPKACIACGKCQRTCPQKIEIPKVMRELQTLLDEMPKWSDICVQREIEAKENKCRKS